VAPRHRCSPPASGREAPRHDDLDSAPWHWSICTLTGCPPDSPPSSLASRRQPSTEPGGELLQSAKRPARHSAMEFLDLGLGSEHVDYQATWDLQRAIHAEVAAGTRPDTVLLLEHASVYTAGKRTEPEERPLDGTPVIDVDRGGKITWHGPGQLVGYPIVRLPESALVVDYVRRLEEAMIAMFGEYGLSTGRIRGRSGVWLAGDADRVERKIAAIGIRVAAGTTMHGFAINVDPDLRWFDRIIPCGLTGVGVTSMAAELGTPVTLIDVAQVLRPHLQRYLAFAAYAQSPDIGSAPDTTTPNRFAVGAA